jgi:hypothetical protein
VAEELLDGLEVKAGQKQVTGEGVPEGMRRNALGDACLSDRRFDGTLDVGFMNMIAAYDACALWKLEPFGRLPGLFYRGWPVCGHFPQKAEHSRHRFRGPLCGFMCFPALFNSCSAIVAGASSQTANPALNRTAATQHVPRSLGNIHRCRLFWC